VRAQQNEEDSHSALHTSHSAMKEQTDLPMAREAPTGPVVVVGLGNPGMEYFWTPHNAGFMAIDRIAEQERVEVRNRRCKALTGVTRIGGREVILAKPETFMNLSGLSVAALLKEFEIGPENRAQRLIVVYDELDLPLGKIKIRERGSPAGHNGAHSVSGALGGNEWLRIRIGVGPDLPAEAIAAGARRRGGMDYLLTPMRKADLTVLDLVLDRVAAAVRRIVEEGPAAAMNAFNREQGTGNREQGTGTRD
jgi:PTH1 family peptidyl-tRNA hydrolase